MKIIRSLTDFLKWRKQITHKEIGLVHTMGNLHDGHISLIKKAKEKNDIIILTIFTNPTQFNNRQDYINYPRTIEQDTNIAKKHNIDIIFLPEEKTIYPDKYSYQINTTTEISKIMEGKSRPGHFSGMMTVVLKVLIICQATRSYYSEKDYQQLELIKKLAESFLIQTEIISCPIIRLPSGLPLSSRNNRLSKKQFAMAEYTARKCRESVETSKLKLLLESQNIKVDYIKDINNRRFTALYIGEVRLIDNFPLRAHPKSQILRNCNFSLI
jgi:pantoate--beta-alanine ligase